MPHHLLVQLFGMHVMNKIVAKGTHTEAGNVFIIVIGCLVANSPTIKVKLIRLQYIFFIDVAIFLRLPTHPV